MDSGSPEAVLARAEAADTLWRRAFAPVSSTSSMVADYVGAGTKFFQKEQYAVAATSFLRAHELTKDPQYVSQAWQAAAGLSPETLHPSGVHAALATRLMKTIVALLAGDDAAFILTANAPWMQHYSEPEWSPGILKCIADVFPGTADTAKKSLSMWRQLGAHDRSR